MYELTVVMQGLIKMAINFSPVIIIGIILLTALSKDERSECND